MPLPYIFPYFSRLILGSSKVDKALLLQIPITKFLLFFLIFFVVSGVEGISMSKYARLVIVVEGLEGLGVLVPMLHTSGPLD